MILKIDKLVKTFPGVKALQGVNFELASGEIHALLGDNGAGKSTLIKVLAGVYPRDSGKIIYQGKNFAVSSPQEAETLGIGVSLQDVTLIPNLSVAENLFLEREPKKMGMIQWGTINKNAQEILKKYELDLDVKGELGMYSIAVQQMIAIARTLEFNSKVMILDEPTSSLNREEVEVLFRQMRRLRDEGCAIIFVTHFLEQVYEVCDRITILENGKNAGTWSVDELPLTQLAARVTSQEDEDDAIIEGYLEELAAAENVEENITASDNKDDGNSWGYELKIDDEQIASLAELLDSGRSELAELVCRVSGTGQSSELRKRVVVVNNPCFTINKELAFAGEAIRREQENGQCTVGERIIRSLQAGREWLAVASADEQQRYTQAYLRLFILEGLSQEKVSALNKKDLQKLVIAVYLAEEPILYIFQESAVAMEINVETGVGKFMLILSAEGGKLVFISSEIEEILNSAQQVSISWGS